MADSNSNDINSGIPAENSPSMSVIHNDQQLEIRQDEEQHVEYCNDCGGVRISKSNLSVLSVMTAVPSTPIRSESSLDSGYHTDL